MTGAVRVADRGGVRLLTIDRPDKANALTAGMLEALRDGVRGARSPVLVLTGSGRVFSAGADLEAARAGLATSPLWAELSEAVATFPGLSVAALNGACAGGALGMMLACDLRVAVPRAAFFYPVMKLGYRPQAADVPRLVSLIGPARTRLMLMAGAKLTAEQALAFGLIDAVDPEPAATASAWATDILTAPPDLASDIGAMIDAAARAG